MPVVLDGFALRACRKQIAALHSRFVQQLGLGLGPALTLQLVSVWCTGVKVCVNSGQHTVCVKCGAECCCVTAAADIDYVCICARYCFPRRHSSLVNAALAAQRLSL